MNRRESLLNLCLSTIGGVLLSFFFACASWGLSGPQTAQLLNQRVLATPVQCVGGRPAYECSGVLMLPMAADHPQPFWHHGAEAEERGAERFYFVRSDREVTPLPSAVGYILRDRFSAIGLGKPYEVLSGDGAPPGEILVKNWPDSEPEKLAVEALYYDSSQPDSLLWAQRGQLEYHEKTQVWLPLVRFVPGDSHGVFGFSQQEQLYDGFQVAARLNARVARTESVCADGRASYYCNGVLTRTTDVGDFHAWDPSPMSIKGNGVSFLYLRADIATSRFYKPQGFVVRQSAYPAKAPLSLRCIFPYDASSSGAPDYCDFRPSCASQGVVSVETWKTHYLQTPYRSCYFDTSAAGYQLALDVRSQSGAEDPRGWLELIIAVWSQGIGDKLPLEAFIHGPAQLSENGLEGARHFQRDYLQTHLRYLPVLEARPAATDGQVFVFKPEEQSVP